jgi:hypothetical protein
MSPPTGRSLLQRWRTAEQLEFSRKRAHPHAEVARAEYDILVDRASWQAGDQMRDKASPPAVRLGSSDCEHIRDGKLAQPANAVSSLAYAVASLAVIRRLAEQPRTLRLLLAAESAALLAASAGSVEYHGMQHKHAQRWHDVSMALALVTTGLVVAYGAWRRDVCRAGMRRLLLLAVSAAAAYGAGRSGSPLCRPDSILQPHAVWHVLSAMTSAAAADVATYRNRNGRGGVAGDRAAR